MTRDRDESCPRPPAAPGRAEKPKKNAAALSAALRANLQRRKARERALRENEASEQKPEDGGDDSEVKWTR